MLAGRKDATRFVLKANLLALGAYLVLAAGWYRVLPDRVPMHFDATGRPDAYGPGDSLAWFLLPVLAVVVDGMLVAFALMMPRVPLRRINVPFRDRLHGLPAEALAPVRDAVSRMLLAVGVLVTLLFAAIQWVVFRASIGTSDTLEFGPPAAALVAVVAGTVVLNVQLARIVKQVAGRARQGPEPRPGNA